MPITEKPRKKHPNYTKPRLSGLAPKLAITSALLPLVLDGCAALGGVSNISSSKISQFESKLPPTVTKEIKIRQEKVNYLGEQTSSDGNYNLTLFSITDTHLGKTTLYVEATSINNQGKSAIYQGPEFETVIGQITQVTGPDNSEFLAVQTKIKGTEDTQLSIVAIDTLFDTGNPNSVGTTFTTYNVATSPVPGLVATNLKITYYNEQSDAKYILELTGTWKEPHDETSHETSLTAPIYKNNPNNSMSGQLLILITAVDRRTGTTGRTPIIYSTYGRARRIS